jgi:hypothetical protein
MELRGVWSFLFFSGGSQLGELLSQREVLVLQELVVLPEVAELVAQLAVALEAAVESAVVVSDIIFSV